jgi:hypothetical protein
VFLAGLFGLIFNLIIILDLGCDFAESGAGCAGGGSVFGLVVTFALLFLGEAFLFLLTRLDILFLALVSSLVLVCIRVSILSYKR